MAIKKNLCVDLAIFFAFLVAFEPHLTGATIHEWFSLALGGAIIVHLLLHWDWIITVGKEFFRKLFHSSRLNFVLDVLLLVAFVTIMLSGLMISRSVLAVFGLSVDAQPTWRFLHSAASNFALLLVGLHVALHWKWILCALKRYVLILFRPRADALQPGAVRSAQAVIVPVEKQKS